MAKPPPEPLTSASAGGVFREPLTSASAGGVFREPLLPEGPGTFRHSVFGRVSFLIGLLLASFLISFLGETLVTGISAEQEIRTLQEADDDLVQILTHLAFLSQPETRFQDFMERLSHNLSSGGAGFGPGFRLPPGVLDVSYFSPEGKRIPLLGFPIRARTMSERGMKLFLECLQSRSGAQGTQDSSTARALFGSEQAPEFVTRCPGKLMDLLPSGVNRLGGWFPVRASTRELPWPDPDPSRMSQSPAPAGSPPPVPLKGHLLAQVHLNHLDPTVLPGEAIKRMQKLARGSFGFGWIDLRQPSKRGWSRSTPLADRWWKWLSEDHPNRLFQFGTRLVRFIDLPQHIRLFGFRELSAREGGASLFRRNGRGSSSHPFGSGQPDLRWVFRFLVFILVFLSGTWVSRRREVPLRWQLIVFFSMASFAGGAALWATGKTFRETREKILVQGLQEEALQILRKADDSFIPSFNRLKEMYKEVVLTQDRKNVPRETFLDPFRTATRDVPFFMAFLLDPEGVVLDSIIRDWESLQVIPLSLRRGWFQAFTPQVFSRLRGETRTPPVANPFFTALKAPRVIDTYVLGMGGWVQTAFAESKNLNLSELVFSPEKGYTGFVAFCHDFYRMESFYLEKVVRSFADQGDLRFVAIPKSPISPIRAIPDGSDRIDAFKLVSTRLNQTGIVQQKIRLLDDRQVLVTAFPGNNIQDFNLVLVSPYEPIARKINLLSSRFAFFSSALMVFILGLGWVMVEALLHPVAELGRGLNALQRLGSHAPLDTRSDDELSEIAAGINSIMGELQELKLAQRVQEQLHPRGAIRWKSIEGQGFIEASGTVSGAFFDLIPIPGERLAILLGEFPGRTVMASLYMAMAKMTLRIFLEEPDKGPGEILRKFHEFLAKGSAPGMGHDLFIGVLGSDSRRLHFGRIGRAGLFALGSEGELIPCPDEGAPIQPAHEIEEGCFDLVEGTPLLIGNAGVLCRAGIREPLNLPAENRGEIKGEPLEYIGNLVLSRLNSLQQVPGTDSEPAILLFRVAGSPGDDEKERGKR